MKLGHPWRATLFALAGSVLVHLPAEGLLPALATVSYDVSLSTETDPGSTHQETREAEGLELDTPLSLQLDQVLLCPAGSVQVVSSQLATGGFEQPPAPPALQTQAEHQVTSCAGGTHGSYGSQLDYEVRVLETVPPPISLTEVPAKVLVRGEASLGGSGSWEGSVSVSLDLAGITTPYSASVERPGDGPLVDGFRDLYRASLPVDGRERVVAIVDVRLSAGIPEDPLPLVEPENSEAVGSGFVDPVFFFDQEALDESLGPESFPLADYFEFEFSEGIHREGSTTPPSVFADDFESGDTSAWSSAVPPPGS